MSEAGTAVEVFCSYAHEDEAWLRKLEIHLSLLKRQVVNKVTSEQVLR